MIDGSRDWLDDLLRDAARTYNPPPDEREMPLGPMWTEIDTQVFGRARRNRHRVYWLGIAAALVVGIGIGRVSSMTRAQAVRGTAERLVSHGRNDDSASRAAAVAPLDPAMSRYIGQATALLIALPNEVTGRRPDQPFIKRASDLLLTTRLLLDSQAAQDPSFRNLLEDLELVLVQVVQLEKDHARTRQTELDLIQQALEQREVIPRLRNAASEYAAD